MDDGRLILEELSDQDYETLKGKGVGGEDLSDIAVDLFSMLGDIEEESQLISLDDVEAPEVSDPIEADIFADSSPSEPEPLPEISEDILGDIVEESVLPTLDDVVISPDESDIFAEITEFGKHAPQPLDDIDISALPSLEEL